MSAFEVGTEVIVRRTQMRVADRPGVITRLGRKYAYVEVYGREVAYDAQTGYEKADGHSSMSRIMTPAMAAKEAERSRLMSALRQHGIRVGYDGIRATTSPRDMQRLLDVLDNPS